ncbi:MAG: RNA polymerase sigma factor [Isosphaeraceae bacterium]
MADIADRWPADAARPPTDKVPSDQSLVKQVRHGNQEAFRLLHQRYADRLLALARSRRSPDLAGRVDVDDIVQSVFGTFFRGIHHGSYDVPVGEEIWGLLLVITLNKIRAKGVYHRAGKRDVRKTAGGETLDQTPDALATDEQAATALRLSVEEALERLTEQQRVVIRLRMEGYEVLEIAGMTGRAKRSVERLLQEGRKRIKELLDLPPS